MAKKIIPFPLGDKVRKPKAVSERQSGWTFRVGNQRYALDLDKWTHVRKDEPARVISIRSARDTGRKSRTLAR